jgi:hypothetical protein
MNTIFLIAQGALFGFLTSLLFPISTHPFEVLALLLLNAVLVVSYGATKND